MCIRDSMKTHPVLLKPSGTKAKLALGMVVLMLAGCKSQLYSLWDNHFMDFGGESCGCESSTVVSRSGQIVTERISPVPMASEPPLASSQAAIIKSAPVTQQVPVMTPTPTQVPSNK